MTTEQAIYDALTNHFLGYSNGFEGFTVTKKSEDWRGDLLAIVWTQGPSGGMVGAFLSRFRREHAKYRIAALELCQAI